MPVVEAVGAAAGTSTAYGFAFESSPGPFSGVGSAAGTSTAQAYSSSEGAGAAAGVATAAAVGVALADSGAGAAAGVATVTGAGQVVIAKVSTNPKNYLLRIVEKRDGAGGLSEIDFVREDLSVYPPDIFAANPLLGSNIHGGAPAPTPSETGDDQSDNSRPGSTRLLLLDIPQLLAEHNQPGFYAAASGLSDGWSGAQLFKKVGQEYIEVARLGDRAAIGRANTKLASGTVTLFNASGRTYQYDNTNTVDVTLIDSVSALASVSDADLLAGANIAALGVHGRWELISFGTVVQLSARKYRLSHLLRGLKGTEHNVANHKAGDSFVVLDSALRRVTDEFADLNTTRKFRAVSVGGSFDAASDVSFENTGVSLKPLSPVYIRGEADVGGNRVIRWWDRSRIDGLAGREGTDPPPLDETSLLFEVDVLNAAGTTVLRTITVTREFALYTAAQQTADHGSVPSSLKVNIYKISPVLGRGYVGSATISVFDSATLPFGEGLTVEEEDGAPSVSNVEKIIFAAGFTVTDNADGSVTVGGGAGVGGMPPIVFRPQQGEPYSSAFATLNTRNNHFVLEFDGTTDEETAFSDWLPDNYTGGGLRVSMLWGFASSTSGSLRVQAAFERINVSGLDMDSDSFAAFKSAGGTAPGTSGQVIKIDIDFTNGSEIDSLLAGEAFRLKIRRDADGTSGTDDITTDAQLRMVRITEIVP